MVEAPSFSELLLRCFNYFASKCAV